MNYLLDFFVLTKMLPYKSPLDENNNIPKQNFARKSTSSISVTKLAANSASNNGVTQNNTTTTKALTGNEQQIKAPKQTSNIVANLNPLPGKTGLEQQKTRTEQQKAGPEQQKARTEQQKVGLEQQKARTEQPKAGLEQQTARTEQPKARTASSSKAVSSKYEEVSLNFIFKKFFPKKIEIFLVQ
jgi:hypothetical protein